MNRSATLKATQAALAAEHAAVYGYGVVGGRIGDDRLAEAREGYAAHRSRRDDLVRTVRDMGGTPQSAAPAYALPFAVPDSAAAVRLAAELENRVAAVYADLVRTSDGALRRQAAGALREAAVRSVRWRGGGVAFPGLT
ncbi:ferritin-like domain-containing protein, partial [Streptomyces botrytidirepellens]